MWNTIHPSKSSVNLKPNDLWHLQVRQFYITQYAEDVLRLTCLVFIWCYWWIVSCILTTLRPFSLLIFFSGAGGAFLVRLRQPHWCDIYMRYHYTVTNWISGTRSYGKYFPKRFRSLFFFSKQCTLDMANENTCSNLYFNHCRCLVELVQPPDFFLHSSTLNSSCNVLETNLVVHIIKDLKHIVCNCVATNKVLLQTKNSI